MNDKNRKKNTSAVIKITHFTPYLLSCRTGLDISIIIPGLNKTIPLPKRITCLTRLITPAVNC